MTQASSPDGRPPASGDAPPSLARRARSLSGLTLLSRVLGVVREQVFARLFGGGMHADALVVAFRIPNLLRDLVAEGALSAAFVPALSRARERGGDRDAEALGRAVLSAILLAVGGVTVLGLVATPWLVDRIAGGFSEGPRGAEKVAETVRLTRILFPFLLLISIAAVLRGVLNTYRRFSVPALGPPLSNLVAIAVGGGLVMAGASIETAATGWAIALLGGGLVSVAVQLPALRRVGLGLRPTLAIRHPELRSMLAQVGTAAIGLAAVQVNIFIATQLASGLEEGSVAALNYAFRLAYLPIGVIGIAIATVTSVDVSARLASGERDHASRDLAGSLRLTAFLALPSAVALWVLAEPIVRLIYEYDQFTPEDTALASVALRGYGAGLLFYGVTKVQVPVCYALSSVRLPVFGSIVAMVGFTIWATTTTERLGVFGLALGTSIAALINCGLLAFGLQRRLGGLGTVWRGIILSGVLSGAMGLALTALLPVLDGWWGHEGMLDRGATVGVSILVGFAIVIGGGRALRLAEASEVLRALGLGRRSPPIR